MRLASPSVVPPHAASAPERRVWDVATVVRRADALLRERTRPLWIRGEVSSWHRHRKGGWAYFTLRDTSAELPCVLSAVQARRLPMLPSDGMEVEVLGQLGIYARRGRFQLEVMRLDSTGAGDAVGACPLGVLSRQQGGVRRARSGRGGALGRLQRARLGRIGAAAGGSE